MAVRKSLIRSLALAAGVLCTAGLLAQNAAVTVTPIPQPATDTGIPFAVPHTGAVSTPSAPDAWGGIRSDSAPTLSDRVVQYEIEAKLDPDKHTIEGKQKLTWRNRSQEPVRSVYLHLYLNAFEGEGSTWQSELRHSGKSFRSGVAIKEGEWGHQELRSVTQGGAKVEWSFVHPDGGPATDHTVVKLDLPAPVAAGASTTLDIAFFDQLPRVMARTGYFGSFHLVGQWFPKIGVLELPGERGATAVRWNVHEFHKDSEFYADFGSYDVRITAPKTYTIGATGELQGAPVEANGLLTHRYVQHDVHDFAWTADKRTAKPMVSTWTGAGSPEVKVTVLYPPEFEASAAPAMKAAKDSLTYFSNTLGPYPYKTLTVVIPPHNAGEAGGMEYPTFITAEGFDKVEPGTVAQYALDFVTIHEFGHGYFYGILASNEFEEPMLDEGLNDYWDNRMARAANMTVGLSTPFLKKIGFAPTMKPFDIERAGTPRDEPADNVGDNAYERLQGMNPIYSRTATTMRDLEARIGKDALERGFKEYYRRWKFRHPSVADLREALAEGTGQRAVVEQVFANQIYKTSKIDDRVAKLTSEEELPLTGTRVGKDGKWVEDKQEDVDKKVEEVRKAWDKAHPDAKPGTGPYPYRTTVTLRRYGAPVPQTVLVKFADGSSEKVVWNDDRAWAKFTWVKPAKAVSAELDPDRLHYLDVSKLDDSHTMKADTSASRRWGSEFAAIIQLLFSFIATV
ncbi:M1 family peptidase [Massilia arenosa]|uniref:M1 family peptidase n=1 Tax=Zemynaea arenosa TaxID=2561931 RepID=A0A4Y9S0L9_9BURK|nr:M1 family metallopeptidase [Massilia arenosa]TFW14874.1 M1 family peptidase [Massilia arenosa]